MLKVTSTNSTAVDWLGILLILGSGLYVFWREVVLDKKFVIKHPMPRNR